MQLENSDYKKILLFSAGLMQLDEADFSFWAEVFNLMNDLWGYNIISFYPYSDSSFSFPQSKYSYQAENLVPTINDFTFWQEKYSSLDPFNPANYSPHLKKQKVISLGDIAAEFENPKLKNYAEYRRLISDQMNVPIFYGDKLCGCLVVCRTPDEPMLNPKDRTILGICKDYLEDRLSIFTESLRHRLRLQFLQETMDSLDEGIVFLDSKFSVTYINQAAKKMILSTMHLQDIEYATHMLVTHHILPKANGASTKIGCLSNYRYQFTTAILPVSTGTPDVMYALHLMPNEEKRISTEEFIARYHLTNREADILAMLLSGKSYQQIANALYISLSTVKSHVANLYQKVGVSRRTELSTKLQYAPRSSIRDERV